MARKLTRRRFFHQGGAAAGLLAIGCHAHAQSSPTSTSPLERLRLAAIGTGNRAAANLAACAGEEIVALADIDENFLSSASSKYKGARTYRDFRVLLEQEADKIDAVLVGTPDHTHAPAAAMAMRLGKHVYCEKPLTHTVQEARRLTELAEEQRLVTQMGTQIHAGENYRRVVELIESGTIGPVREVHVWVAVDYSGAQFTAAPKPDAVDWDLWLGPAAERPYTVGEIQGKTQPLHPAKWRWCWDFGSGGLGDFGCHYMDLAHWALRLSHPTSVRARGPEPQPLATSSGLIVDYHYPARDELPPVQLTWYDGGQRPAALAAYRDAEGAPLNWPSGQLFVGRDGAVLSDYNRHLILPQERGRELPRPEPYLPPSVGHHQEWLAAIRAGTTTSCHFGYAGPLTEAVLLGVVAYRSGLELEWDAPALTIRNAPQAQHLIHKPYRDGWTL